MDMRVYDGKQQNNKKKKQYMVLSKKEGMKYSRQRESLACPVLCPVS